jgi:hypothetical protein
MASINEINRNIDQTVRVFDTFYRNELSIPANEYDLVYSYFRSQIDNDITAGNFTVSLFQVAKDTRIAPLVLLQEFENNGTGINLTANLAYYLNLIRNRATLLGVQVAVQPNFYAQQLVLQ